MGPGPLGKCLGLSFMQKMGDKLEMIWIVLDTAFMDHVSEFIFGNSAISSLPQ